MKSYNEASGEATSIALDEERVASKSATSPNEYANRLRDAAVRLARKGFKVFPLVPNGKVPAFKDQDWKVTASDDPDRVHRLWSEALSGDPLDFNIGIATGSGLFVLDIDNKDGKHGSAIPYDLFRLPSGAC